MGQHVPCYCDGVAWTCAAWTYVACVYVCFKRTLHVGLEAAETRERGGSTEAAEAASHQTCCTSRFPSCAPQLALWARLHAFT